LKIGLRKSLKNRMMKKSAKLFGVASSSHIGLFYASFHFFLLSWQNKTIFDEAP